MAEFSLERAEQSLIKKFHRQIFRKFTKAVATYDLIAPGDKIAVCISGGKDSMLLGAAFQHLQKYSENHYEAVKLTMDTG